MYSYVYIMKIQSINKKIANNKYTKKKELMSVCMTMVIHMGIITCHDEHKKVLKKNQARKKKSN